MKNNVRRLLAMLLSVVLVCSVFAACSNEVAGEPSGNAGKVEQGDEEQIKAVLVSVMSGGDYWGPIEEGFLETCEKYGWHGEYWAPVTTNSGAEMVELIETAITQGFDVISTCITDPNVFNDVLTRAKEAGIVLVATTAPSYDLCDVQVGMDMNANKYEMGAWMAKYAMEQGFTELNVVTFQTMMATDQNEQRDYYMQGLIDTFDGPVNDLGQETCESNAATTQDKLGAIYVAHPELNMIGGLESYAVIGAASFVQDNALQGKVLTVGNFLTEDTLAYFENDVIIGTGVTDCKPLGINIVEAAKQIMDGVEPTAAQGIGGTVYYTKQDVIEMGLIEG